MPEQQELLFLRDLADVEPPRDRYKHYDEEDIYKLVPKPQWTGLEDEIWTPRANENDPQLERVKGAHAARAAPPPSRARLAHGPRSSRAALIKRNNSDADGADAVAMPKDAEDEDFTTKVGHTPRLGPKEWTSRAINHKAADIGMLVATLWALFGAPRPPPVARRPARRTARRARVSLC